jgi:hypothetical protein
MKTYSVRGKRSKDVSYIDLWPACDTDMKIRKAKVGQLLDEVKDPFSRWWNATAIRTLVKSIDDKVYGALIRECEHLFQTSCQNRVTGLLFASVVVRMKTRQNITTKFWASRKLSEKGRDHVMQALLIGAPEIEIKISYWYLSWLAHSFDIFDDRGAERQHEITVDGMSWGLTNQMMLLPEPATIIIYR